MHTMHYTIVKPWQFNCSDKERTKRSSIDAACHAFHAAWLHGVKELGRCDGAEHSDCGRAVADSPVLGPALRCTAALLASMRPSSVEGSP